MEKTRVLVVDDSIVVRRMLTEILGSDPALEVVGTAGSAAQALSKVTSTQPDVVTLDVELPDTSGLELLEALRKQYPKLPIIMFSSLTQRGGATTLDALARGATDYATKPCGVSSREEAAEHVRRELVPKVLAFGKHPPRRQRPTGTMPAVRLPSPVPSEWKPAELVAIGCSTGGPNALMDLFSALPPNLGTPIVIVQHMPPIFTKLLAERLSSLGRIPVREAQEGDPIEAGKALIAPGGHHMRVVRRANRECIALDQTAPVNSCRPAVDRLFESVIDVYGGRVLAVVLTGMGQDGLVGCERVRAAGGQVITQDEASSVVWGMPGFVTRKGLSQAVLPLDQIAPEIVVRTARGATSASQPRLERPHVA